MTVLAQVRARNVIDNMLSDIYTVYLQDLSKSDDVETQEKRESVRDVANS